MPIPASIPHILEVQLISGAKADGAGPQLVIELPHGATEHAQYQHHQAEMKGALPEQLDHFFFVNTDIASPEIAVAMAEAVVKLRPTFSVLILRSLIPRTLIDCNRILTADDAMIQAGKVTPGMPPYIQDAEDIERLVSAHQSYQQAVTAAIDAVCLAGGRLLFLHTYAPRTVGISTVDASIVAQLHWAYAPEQLVRWPIRPQVDFISLTPDGEELADTHWLTQARSHLTDAGFQLGTGGSYPLHPVTTAYHHAKRHPKQSLCMEVRRDVLVSAFRPFEQMYAQSDKIQRISDPLAAAFVAVFSA